MESIVFILIKNIRKSDYGENKINSHEIFKHSWHSASGYIWAIFRFLYWENSFVKFKFLLAETAFAVIICGLVFCYTQQFISHEMS